MRKHFGREQNGNGSAARLCHNLDLLQGCQTILTFYKGVSHVVIGMAIIILSEDRVVLVLPKLVNLFGALQLVLGSVLLRGITKASRHHISAYLILNVASILLEKICGVYLLVLLWDLPVAPLVLLFFYFAIYCVFRWTLFYCVYSYNRQLDEGQNFEFAICIT
jgi:hypothetical protein